MSQIVTCKYYIFPSENSPHNFPASKQFEFLLKILSEYCERIAENFEKYECNPIEIQLSLAIYR